MTEKLLSVITPIQEQTGLDIDVYTFGGERIASTHYTKDLYTWVRPTEEELVSADGIIQDKKNNVTGFLVKIMSKNYVGVIMGSNAISRNYGILVARLIENALVNLAQNLDRVGEFRLLIEGGMTRLQSEQFKAKHGSAGLPYFVLTVMDMDKDKELSDYLKEMCTDSDVVVPMADGSIVMLKNCTDLDEYQSASDFAHMLSQNIFEETAKKPFIGVGDIADHLDDIPECYNQSITAIRLGKLLDVNSRVFYHKDYFLINIFEELPKDILSRYVETNVNKETAEIFDDRELMDTAEQFLLGSLNISETARIMFMHRNTLIYRLDKIEKATGLNIRRFADAMTFRALSILHKLANA